MRVLVFGHSGQLAQALQRRCPSGWQVLALGRDAADLADPAACASVVARCQADVVINAAAYTAVDRAEDEVALATTINGDAPGAMAQAAAARGLPFLHVSTDYVFDGSGTKPWATDAPANPLGAYGRSKLAGERAVQAVDGTYAILRTSWVFSAQGSNFVKTMLRLGAARETINVVADQIGGPTSANDIAAALFTMAAALQADHGMRGIYHLSGGPDVSWADFAREIFTQSQIGCQVCDIPSSAYPTPAKRPANSRLDCASLETVFGITRPDWRGSLGEILEELKGDIT